MSRRLIVKPAFLLFLSFTLVGALTTRSSHADEQNSMATVRTPEEKAALAKSRLYHPPELPDANNVNVDNVYSMQMLTLPNQEKMREVGRRMFFDPALSGSGKLACASCHSPSNAYGPPNNLSVQLGGVQMNLMGNRAAPSLRYLEHLPPFVEHYFDLDNPTGIDQGPTGGFGWDGRFSTLHSQAGLPLLASNEMANANVADVVAKLRRADYVELFRATFGADALDQDGKAFKWMTLALEYFQRDPKEFFPFNSKFDAYMRGQATLSEQEQRGLKIFDDKEKGNCAACHVDVRGHAGALPDFTDYGLVVTGAPRNMALTNNKNADFYDLGLCGPYRSDMSRHKEYCGAFRTPTLRNVALRQTFFHNGVFHSLREVLEFYATRDTDPRRWYPRIKSGPDRGKIDQYNDLPKELRKNVNHDAPFSPDSHGRPRLSKSDIDDLIAFMQTLTDGYQLPEPHISAREGEKEKK